MSLIGYARVSTDPQDDALQLTDLNKAGCSRIFEEKISIESPGSCGLNYGLSSSYRPAERVA
jgi:DNA invertase Pin-like site-specific DNA recombinase